MSCDPEGVSIQSPTSGIFPCMAQSYYAWHLEDADREGELRGMSLTSQNQEDWEVPKHLHYTTAVPSIEVEQGYDIRWTNFPEKK